MFVNGNAGGALIYKTLPLPNVVLAAGDYYVVCANAANTVNCDLDTTPDTDLIQNGAPDALALAPGATILDTVSYEGNTGSPYTEGTGAGHPDTAAAARESINRCPDGSDTDANNADFLLRIATPGAANDCPGVDQPPSVSSTTPTNGATAVTVDANVSLTFSEPVELERLVLDLVRHLRRPPAAVPPRPDDLRRSNPAADFADGEICTVTISAAG